MTLERHFRTQRKKGVDMKGTNEMLVYDGVFRFLDHDVASLV